MKKEKNWTVLLIVSRFVPLFRTGSFVFFGFSVFGFSRSKRMGRTNRWPKKQKETNQAVSSFFRLFALDLFRSRFLFREMMMMMMMEKKKKMATSNRPAMAAGKRSLNFGQAKMFPFFRFIFLLYQSTKAQKQNKRKETKDPKAKKTRRRRCCCWYVLLAITRASYRLVPVFQCSTRVGSRSRGVFFSMSFCVTSFVCFFFAGLRRCTEFCLCSLGTRGHRYLVLPSFTQFYLFLPSFTYFYQVLPSFS